VKTKIKNIISEFLSPNEFIYQIDEDNLVKELDELFSNEMLRMGLHSEKQVDYGKCDLKDEKGLYLQG
jgi:hypothetical protein